MQLLKFEQMWAIVELCAVVACPARLNGTANLLLLQAAFALDAEPHERLLLVKRGDESRLWAHLDIIMLDERH